MAAQVYKLKTKGLFLWFCTFSIGDEVRELISFRMNNLLEAKKMAFILPVVLYQGFLVREEC
jgi:hypothetical protein